MHWVALPSPHAEEALPPGVPAAAAGWWALRFTPRVALLDEAVLLEVAGTERLWGGREHLLALLREHHASAGPGTGRDGAPDTLPGGGRPLAEAPTALQALALLRLQQAGRAVPRRVPHGLPLATLTALRPHAASLERMGCRTWAAVRALPRDGAARRFGAEPLRALDQAWGDVPHPVPWLELPERFEMRAELPALATSAEQLLWTAGRLLGALRGWLQARHQGVLALELEWRHDLRRIDGVDLPASGQLAVRTAEATQDLVHLRRLLSERLARQPLAAPVNHLTLRATDTACLPQASESLLPPSGMPGEAGGACEGPGAAGESWHQWVERLSARWGPGQVRVPVLEADHRPERMQRWEAAAGQGAKALAPARPRAGRGGAPAAPPPAEAAGTAADAAFWPGWLVHPPRPLALQGDRPCLQGPLRLLAGPHRFDGGWWEACAERREYFVADNPEVGTVWIYRQWQGEGTTGRFHWFWHGVYA
ncbi:Y-family DNA polymerase [Acidovorax sp. NCPPB 4044]|uniref:Y-family DNA polymerase n=1 Tax=Acidovorax sp. NCPPB 4044 TaxID=2940490 RepID=UPI00230285F3|nr:DNA polymerase Y family protein [Acidovorax sp. NCPPB 4044]MDA8521182.1 DNA polymerase Y family protein [Acidovorax sp. NCPPB 4044]